MSTTRINKTGAPQVILTTDGRLTGPHPDKRRGRKLVPQLALARGHRWLAMLEAGEAKSLKEIAEREGVDNSYVSRMVKLNTLAPKSSRRSWTTHCRITSR